MATSGYCPFSTCRAEADIARERMNETRNAMLSEMAT